MTSRFTRRRGAAFAGAICISTILNGCSAGPNRAGLFVSAPEGAPRWIDDTVGAPAWSVNGKDLTWADERGLRIWNATDGQVTLATTTPIVGRPTWSPDGQAIAFLNKELSALESLAVTTGEVTQLAPLSEGTNRGMPPPIVSRGGPAWSPDGSRIAFIGWDGEGDELFIVGPDGRSKQQLTALGANQPATAGSARSSVTSMAWSPDGKSLAVSVTAEVSGAVAGVFLIEVISRTGTRITKTVVNAPLVWAPASGNLIYSATIDGRSDVFRVPVGGGDARSVSGALPDGARDATVAEDGTLAVVSGRSVAVMPPGNQAAQFVELQGLSCMAPALSPDGRSLAFLALPRPIERYL